MRDRLRSLLSATFLIAVPLSAAPPEPATQPAWTHAAADRGPLTADETRAFMKQLAQYVEANHLKGSDSPQRGMLYEYFDPSQKGKPQQYVEGEALDTMHDGCWYAAAMVAAHRATGDDYY